jgi:hypothetical protein
VATRFSKVFVPLIIIHWCFNHNGASCQYFLYFFVFSYKPSFYVCVHSCSTLHCLPSLIWFLYLCPLGGLLYGHPSATV